MRIDANGWYYSTDYGLPCQVIYTETLWGETNCRVWFPGHDLVSCVPASGLKSLEYVDSSSSDRIAYVVAAARVAHALTEDVLLAPIVSSVIPLPHQIRALSRAISHDRVRYLLADEVGLGKTIEAGLIMRELKLRGLVQRTLVVVPKGLANQWVSEIKLHFGETFQLVLPEDLRTLRGMAPWTETIKAGNRLDPTLDNPWRLFPQVIVPMDSVKPLDKRKGWSAAQVEEYNHERFEDLISAGWDLVIVDEAHRLGGSTDQVARFKLGRGLSESAPYLLLLSATPHQGKTDAFHRLMSLVDPQAFPDVESVTNERVQPYVIRTEKRKAIDTEGKQLFKPRRTQLVPVSWQEHHRPQRILYEKVTEYVREGYNLAMKEKRTYIGFLMILMQRLVASSTSAIRTTLEKRLEALTLPSEQLALFSLSDEEWADLDGQEQMETLLHARLTALRNERTEVKMLLEAAARSEQAGDDAKAEALLEWIYRLQSEEGESDLKVLVFTEFVPTQTMLCRFLVDRGFSVVCLNGSMDIKERKRVQDAFAKEARILISTDAGGEGLNLQFCHVVINYDIPWNPMRLEQRIGRVDRIGQIYTVRAINFVFEETVEHRVREVLEEKLAIIFEEFGIDKTGDVLDSAQAGQMFDKLYLEAILNPEKVEESVHNVVTKIQEQVRDARANGLALGTSEDLDPRKVQQILAHPLPDWVERMTVSYLKAYRGRAEKRNERWNLIWPDGETYPGVVFTGKEADQIPSARHVTLEDPKVRSLVMNLPLFVPGQPVPIMVIPGLSEEVQGVWSLWQISVVSHESYVAGRLDGDRINRSRIMPFFLADNDRVFMLTAGHIWDQLLVVNPKLRTVLDGETSLTAFTKSRKAVEEYGRSIYEELLQEHRNRITREREKTKYAFEARRKTVERIGLPQVRRYRLNLLTKEEQNFQEKLKQRAQVHPELELLALARVEGGQS